MNGLVKFFDGAVGDPRSGIAALERELAKMPQIVCPVTHTFSPGIYAREIFVPAGACVTGKIHLHDHISIVLGDITVRSKDGLQRLSGFQTIVTTAGVKRAVFAHDGTWWTTIHHNPTNERDLAKLEAMLIAPDYDTVDRLLEAA